MTSRLAGAALCGGVVAAFASWFAGGSLAAIGAAWRIMAAE